MLAIARASGVTGQLMSVANSYVGNPVTANVPPGAGWALYDLGTFQMKASQTTSQIVSVGGAIPSVSGVGVSAALQVAGVIMLPDAHTWFFANSPSGAGIVNSSCCLLDDILGDQFFGGNNFSAASPAGLTPTNRITQYTRGLLPTLDPKNGPPIIAVIAAAGAGTFPYPLLSAQVNVLERARYVLP
jgi:hypothetical protein